MDFRGFTYIIVLLGDFVPDTHGHQTDAHEFCFSAHYHTPIDC